jgi:hypothetical protein
MMLLAIDPGLDTGWAILLDGKLLNAGLGDPPAATGCTKVVIERPQIYQGRSSRANPNDLITLAIQVGRYTERFAAGRDVEHLLPHTWKGTVDPDILCRRVWASLDEREKDLLGSRLSPLAREPFNAENLTEGKRHNVIDAVGLAKWSLKRARAGVFEVLPR